MKQKTRMMTLFIIIIILILVIIFLVGGSFGFLRYAKEGETVNVISIKGIEVEILNKENNALVLKDAYPISDSDAMLLTPFEFKMKNASGRSLSYSIRIELDEEKMKNCILEDNTPCLELSTNHIKYAYKKNNGSYTEPRNLGRDGNIITTDTIQGKENVISSIILWIDSDSGNEIMNHTFYGKLIITGQQQEN